MMIAAVSLLPLAPPSRDPSQPSSGVRPATVQARGPARHRPQRMPCTTRQHHCLRSSGPGCRGGPHCDVTRSRSNSQPLNSTRTTTQRGLSSTQPPTPNQRRPEAPFGTPSRRNALEAQRDALHICLQMATADRVTLLQENCHTPWPWLAVSPANRSGATTRRARRAGQAQPLKKVDGPGRRAHGEPSAGSRRWQPPGHPGTAQKSTL